MAGFEEYSLLLPDDYPAVVRYWPVEKPRGAVLVLHGIQSHFGWYERSAERLQQAGYCVLQPDRRGSGHNPIARGHADSPRQLISDGFCCADELLDRSGLSRFHLAGISWGGKLAAAMYVEQPVLIRSLTLVCPGLFPRIDVGAMEKLRIGFSMLGDRGRLFDIPLNDPELFTSQPQWIRFLREDPLTLHQATASFFLVSRRMDSVVRHLPKSPPIPLYLFLADEDRIIDSPATAQYVRNLNWPAARITSYPQSRHTLEFEPIADQFCSDWITWLKSISESAP